MRRLLFVVNGILNPSGAEFVLYDFLRMNPDIEVFLLILGNNERSSTLFRRIIPNEKTKIIIDLNFRFNSITRVATMSYEVYRFKKFELEIKQYINENKIDVLYTNNTIEAMLLNSLDLCVPVICHIHDIISTFKPAFLMEVKKSLSKARKIIAVSQATKDSMIREGMPEDKISVIYNGINVNKEFDIHKYENSNNNDFIYKIAYVGGCTKRKGVDVLIHGLNVFAKSNNKKIELNMVMHIGNSRFEKKVLTKLDKRIIVNRFDNMKREDVVNLYHSIHLTIVPSRKDPLPTVVLESLSEGTPVIGAKVDGIPEIICDERLLFQAGNWNALSLKLSDLLTMNILDLKKSMREQQKYLKEVFSFKTKAKNVLDVINSV